MGAVIARLHSLNRDVLVAVERSHHGRLIGKRDPVRRVGREETLQQCGPRIEHGGALATDFDTDGDLLQVDEVGVDAPDVRRRGRVEVEVAEVLPELVRLDLCACKGEFSC